MYVHAKIYWEKWRHDFHTRWINILHFHKFLFIVNNQESHNRNGYKDFIVHQNICLKELYMKKKSLVFIVIVHRLIMI